MREKYKEQLTLVLTGFFIIALGILFFFLIFRADSVRRAFGSLVEILMPFVYGIVIAYLLRPTCNFFERNLRSLSRKLWKKERRGLCVGLSIALSFLLFFLIAYLLLAMMIPQLLRSIRVISVRIPLFLEVVQEWIERLFADNQVISSYLGDSVEDIETSLREWIQGSLLPSLNNVMNNFTNGVMGLSISCTTCLSGSWPPSIFWSDGNVLRLSRS